MAKFEQGILVVKNGLAFEQLTVSTTSIGLAAIPANHRTRWTVIQSDTQTIRWMAFPGCAPTGSTGMKLAAGDILVYDGEPEDLRLVRDSSAAADATVLIHYFGV